MKENTVDHNCIEKDWQYTEKVICQIFLEVGSYLEKRREQQNSSKAKNESV